MIGPSGYTSSIVHSKVLMMAVVVVMVGMVMVKE